MEAACGKIVQSENDLFIIANQREILVSTCPHEATDQLEADLPLEIGQN